MAQTEDEKSEPYIPDDPVHFERFMDAARQLGVQESEDAFQRALRALLKLKPKRKDGGS